MVQVVWDGARPDLGGNFKHGDVRTFCPRLWSFLVDRFAARSVLDVGCGEGHAVAYFRKLGVIAHGIDGLIENVRNAVTPIAVHDLLSGPYVMPVDLVWSCEVAEHIFPEKVHHFIDTLTNGRAVAMTHAVPGQSGHHHVNCQPDEYWIRLMDERGYELDGDPETYRTIAQQELTGNYFVPSGLVFTRR